MRQTAPSDNNRDQPASDACERRGRWTGFVSFLPAFFLDFDFLFFMAFLPLKPCTYSNISARVNARQTFKSSNEWSWFGAWVTSVRPNRPL